MGKMISAAAALVVALFFVGMLVPAVGAEPVEAPEWQEGDKWALGWDQSFSVKNNATVNAALAGIISEMTGATFEEASASLSAGAAIYVLFEVIDVTDDTYVVSTKLAIKLEADASASMTGQLPKAGTYSVPSGPDDEPDFSDVPTEEKTVSVGLGADFAFVVEGTTVFDKTTMAVKSFDLEAKASAIISIDATNLPDWDDEDDGSVTISYKNYDIDLKTVLTLDVSIVFTPALNLYDFPLNDGDTWDIDTEVNVTGEIGGFLDITGLPEEVKEDFFSIDILQEANITSFPIHFIDLIPEDSELSDGQFGPLVERISASFTANELDDGVYEITTDGGFKFHYSPSLKFVSGASLSSLPVEIPVDISTFMPFLGPVDVDKAADEIASISAYQADIANRATSNPDSLTDFFFKAPFTGLILVVVAAIIVGGALFMVTRARKK